MSRKGKFGTATQMKNARGAGVKYRRGDWKRIAEFRRAERERKRFNALAHRPIGAPRLVKP